MYIPFMKFSQPDFLLVVAKFTEGDIELLWKIYYFLFPCISSA